MDKWYISQNSKARGPYSDLQMREKIKKGELRASTLIYKEGDLDWMPLKQQSIWSPALENDTGHSFVEKSPGADLTRDWVLLVENPIKKGDFKQQGPYSKKTVLEMLDIGEVHLNDYCWKKGMSKWTKLVNMSELSLTRKETNSFKSQPETAPISSKDLEFKKSKNEFRTPFDSDMPDLLEPLPPVNYEEESKTPEKTKAKSQRAVKRVRFLPSLQEEFQYKKQTKIFLGLVLILFISGLALGYLNRPALIKISDLAQTAYYGAQSRLFPQYNVSYLMVKPSVLDKNLIRFKTDAEQGQEVLVEVESLSGATMTHIGSNKNYIYVPIDRVGVAEFKLSEFDLQPFKNYFVKAKIGGLNAKKQITFVP